MLLVRKAVGVMGDSLEASLRVCYPCQADFFLSMGRAL